MLEEIETFICVVQEKSFSAASEQLGISTSAVTRRITALEHSLQTRLFQRNTRAISLTEAGEVAYDNLFHINRSFLQTKRSIKELEKGLVGKLKIGLPASLAYLKVIPALAAFMQTYPEIKLDLVNGNHLIDLVDHNFDLIIHCGELPDSNYYAKSIGSWEQVLCASPDYLEKSASINKPSDLAEHNCLIHFDNKKSCWDFILNGCVQPVPVTGNVKLSSSMSLKRLALEGLGIAYLPSFTVHQELAQGKLISLLPDYQNGPLPIYVVYSSKQYLSKKAQAFIEFLKSLSFSCFVERKNTVQ